MTARARYRIAQDEQLKVNPLVIRDVGRWDCNLTVTNDVEAVVADLAAAGRLPHGRRLFYIDRAGEENEILVVEGQFAGFAPGPRRR